MKCFSKQKFKSWGDLTIYPIREIRGSNRILYGDKYDNADYSVSSQNLDQLIYSSHITNITNPSTMLIFIISIAMTVAFMKNCTIATPSHLSTVIHATAVTDLHTLNVKIKSSA